MEDKASSLVAFGTVMGNSGEAAAPHATVHLMPRLTWYLLRSHLPVVGRQRPQDSYIGLGESDEDKVSAAHDTFGQPWGL